MARYRMEPHEKHDDEANLESVEATYADDGKDIFFVSGYSAREISRRHHEEHGGTIWVNSVSRKIVRQDYQYASNAPVYYAVHQAPVYTLIRHEGTVVRAYWPALGE